MTDDAPRLTPVRFMADGALAEGPAALAGAARQLLAAAHLPPPGPGDQPMVLLVAERDGVVVACGGYEPYGPYALLRSLAVTSEARGAGLGRWMVGRILARLAVAHPDGVWLLTETAAPFFVSLGFRPVERSAIPGPVHASRQLNGGCCATATAMELVKEGTTRV